MISLCLYQISKLKIAYNNSVFRFFADGFSLFGGCCRKDVMIDSGAADVALNAVLFNRRCGECSKSSEISEIHRTCSIKTVSVGIPVPIQNCHLNRQGISEYHICF